MHNQSKEDRRFREALEKRSISKGRADVVSGLNRLAASDALQRPGLSSYLLLQAARRTHGAEFRKLNRAHDRGGFDRLHPASALARTAADRPKDVSSSEEDEARDDVFASPLRAGRVNDADGSMAADAQTHRDKFAGQGVRAAEPEWLTVEQMAALAAARTMASRYF